MAETISGAIGRLANTPAGAAMGEILKLIQQEIGDVPVTVSGDLHRAELTLPNGKRSLAKVTEARPRGNASRAFRFKPPNDAAKYETIYFGGLSIAGKPVLYRRTAKDIGSLRTVTFAAS